MPRNVAVVALGNLAQAGVALARLASAGKRGRRGGRLRQQVEPLKREINGRSNMLCVGSAGWCVVS